MAGHLVVQRATRGIGYVREPVDAAASGGMRGRVYRFDELPADAPAAVARGGKQILQVADVVEPRRAAMKEEMHEGDDRGVLDRDERIHRLVEFEEPLPGRPRDALGQRGRPDPLVEGV